MRHKSSLFTVCAISLFRLFAWRYDTRKDEATKNATQSGEVRGQKIFFLDVVILRVKIKGKTR